MFRFTALLLLASAGAAGWLYREQISAFFESPPGSDSEPAAAPDPETYTALSDDLEKNRQRLGQRYRQAGNNSERAKILGEARELLEDNLPALMRCWLGTPWDFNGTAHEPGRGEVACGYFVSSVLQDAGFRVEWARLAQQASQNILGTFVPRAEMNFLVGVPYQEFLDAVGSSGRGIYIVGLDSHVAFLVVPEEGEIRFIHSSGASPYCVVDESRDDAHVLRHSNYRVTGNLTASGEVVRSWLLGTDFKTQTL